MSATGAHQGIIALAAAHGYATVEEMLQRAADRGEAPLLILCDELTDPHNLGAILRSASAPAPMASSFPSAAAWA